MTRSHWWACCGSRGCSGLRPGESLASADARAQGLLPAPSVGTLGRRPRVGGRRGLRLGLARGEAPRGAGLAEPPVRRCPAPRAPSRAALALLRWLQATGTGLRGCLPGESGPGSWRAGAVQSPRDRARGSGSGPWQLLYRPSFPLAQLPPGEEGPPGKWLKTRGCPARRRGTWTEGPDAGAPRRERVAKCQRLPVGRSRPVGWGSPSIFETPRVRGAQRRWDSAPDFRASARLKLRSLTGPGTMMWLSRRARLSYVAEHSEGGVKRSARRCFLRRPSVSHCWLRSR